MVLLVKALCLVSDWFYQLNPGFGKADQLNLFFKDLFFTKKCIDYYFAVLESDLSHIFHNRLLDAGRV
jgi:hypothetical protein